MAPTPAERWAAQQHDRRVGLVGEHTAADWEALVAESFPGLGVSAREQVLALMLDTWRAGPGPRPGSTFDPATLASREALGYARALSYATAALEWAAERYPDFRAWCLTQPFSPDARKSQLEAAENLLREAAHLAWQQTDVKPPGRGRG